MPVFGVIALQQPPARAEWPSLLELLNKRSTRYASKPLSIVEVSELLWHAARVRDADEIAPQQVSHRASPSAGGLHPIEVFVQNIEGVENNVYRYDPYRHQLLMLCAEQDVSDALRKEAQNCLSVPVATVLWLVATPSRTESRYEHPVSLVLRDAGVLLSTLGLTAEALGLWPVPLGVTGEPIVSTHFVGSVPLYGVGGLHVSRSGELP